MTDNIQKLETSDGPYLFQHIYKRGLDKLKSYYRIRPKEKVAQAPNENASAELPASSTQELIDMRSAEVKARWFVTAAGIEPKAHKRQGTVSKVATQEGSLLTATDEDTVLGTGKQPATEEEVWQQENSPLQLWEQAGLEALQGSLSRSI